MLIIKKLNKIRWGILFFIEDVIYSIKAQILKHKYMNFEDDEYNIGELKFIWGIKSWDDATSNNSNMYTMNDIDITYDRKKKLYYLGIETGYLFENSAAECKYLRQLLNVFTNFMDKNKYSKSEPLLLLINNSCMSLSAETIEELYIKFKIFVEGYCKVYKEIIT